MKVHEKLKSLRIVMVSHIFATGAFLDLEQFLIKRVDSLFFIGHPFSFRHDIRSFFRYYEKGKLKKEHKALPWQLPDVFWYIKDACYTFLWILRSKNKFDMYIGADNFDAYLGLLLKRLGKVEDVVFYTIDYIPNRFKIPFLNFLYHFFDRECLRNAKIVWNISPNMVDAREQFGHLRKEDCVPQIVVPQGVWHKRIAKLPLSKKDPYRIVFLGHLVARQGLDLVIEAMPAVLQKIPKASLLIIGSGDCENILKKLVAKNRLGNIVRFSGFIEKDANIEKELSYSTIAVAMYKPDPNSLTNFADPMKIKVYLSAGLPIILTEVPPIARDLEKKKCAIISTYETSELAKNIIDLLSNPKKLSYYSKNAITFAEKFDYEKIYTQAFQKTLN